MSIKLEQLIEYTDNLLEPHRFNDYCPNGLQVEGKPEITKIMSGVTASQALLEAAIERSADVVLVHHGYFWKGESPRITGMLRTRLKCLLDHGISLVAYHLPLDAHPELGNNAQLAKVLDIEICGSLVPGDAAGIGLAGRLPEPLSGQAFAEHLQQKLGRKPLYVAGNDRRIETIGWCTGAAQGYIDKAVAAGVDAYLTGEVSEPTVHIAREQGIQFFAAGHHATERYGVKALGEHLATALSLEHEFVDIDNPV